MSIDLDRAVSTASVNVFDAIDGDSIRDIADDVIKNATWKKVSPFIQNVIGEWGLADIDWDCGLSTQRIFELAAARWLEHQPKVHKAMCNDYEECWLEVNFHAESCALERGE